MAPRRPSISVGIQPQTMWYGVILGTVCGFGWYTEKYRRDEEDIDHRLKKMYLQNAQEAQTKMPQMAAAIRGQSTALDGNMDRMVWGGKAKLASNSGLGDTPTSTEEEPVTTEPRIPEEKKQQQRRKKKRKKENAKPTNEALVKEQQQKLILQSSLAGVAVGAVAVAAISTLMGGGMGGMGGRK